MTGATPAEDDSPARRVLKRLLRRAEAALSKGDARPVSLSMTGSRDGAEYLALRGVSDFEPFHARIALAERGGAITVERDRYRDDGQLLLRLVVRDLPALAHDLGIELASERMGRACALLAPWRLSFPLLEAVLAGWQGGATVRGHGPAAAVDLADAARAVSALQSDVRGERVLRKASAELFGDSKRLEALTAWLDVLVTGEVSPSGLEDEQVWSALGLRKEPQLLRLSGQGELRLGNESVRLPRSVVGFQLDAVSGIRTGARALLSIENLASFHEAAALAGESQVLLVYTGGMPSPAWRAAYLRLLAGLAADTRLYHWGDIDRGGFRIAARLADMARQSGRMLHPWLMAPADLPADIVAAAAKPTPAVLANMCDWARRAGWEDVCNDLQRAPLLLEQERLHPQLP